MSHSSRRSRSFLQDRNYTGKELPKYYDEVARKPLVDQIGNSLKTAFNKTETFVSALLDKTPTSIKVATAICVLAVAIFVFGIGHRLS